ncbi:MAG: prenyltransferase [Clostridia bacterium]|nr:prenyltransferase [Clostridia bacterium]
MLLKQWLRVLRAHFFAASAVPVLLGTTLAGFEIGEINFQYFLVIFVGVLACHGGANLLNDYYDHFSENDISNPHRSPFNGGSGCIQEGLISPRKVKIAAIGCIAISLLVGLFFTFVYGPYALLYALAGTLSGYIYSGFPRLSYRGLGEILVGLNFGPLIVTGTHYVQGGFFSIPALLLSIPMGFLVTAVLYLNQFPDYHADKSCGKRNWVVRLGRKPALKVYILLLGAAYWTLLACIALKVFPTSSLLALITLPFAILAVLIAVNWYNNPPKLLRASALTVFTHLGVGFLLVLAFLWEIYR